MKQLSLLVSMGAALAGGAALVAREQTPPARAAAPPENVLRADVGDVIRVGTKLICKVERRDGLKSLTCLRSGPLRGTYGTRVSGRDVRVFRFERESVARTVFSATHNAGFTTCGQCR